MFFNRFILSYASAFILLSITAQTSMAFDFHFSWLPNNEPNVAGYRIYYGTTSGEYYLNDYTEVDAEPDMVTGRVQGTISNLDETEVYYFAVTAVTDDFLVSDFSSEITYRPDCPITGMPPLERGEIKVSNQWQLVELQTSFTDPVVVASITSNNETDPSVVRISEITSSGFKIKLQEFEYLDGVHEQETVDYIVMESGSYTLPNGALIEAGTFKDQGINSLQLQTFKKNFNTPPVVMTTIVTVNDEETVTGRIDDITRVSFAYMMQEQEANTDGHSTETISYIAWEPSDGTINGVSYSVGRQNDVSNIANITYSNLNRADFQHSPIIVTNMITSYGEDPAIINCTNKDTTEITIQLREDQSKDVETSHCGEHIGYIAISNTSLPPFEAGEVEINTNWARINFVFKYYHPVIVAKITSFNGSDPAVVRITDVNQTGCSIKIQEWPTYDQEHTLENVSYFVMEQGTYILADGTHIEAENVSSSTGEAFDKNIFKQHYTVPPVIITSISSYNDQTTVTGRIRKINNDWGEYMLQEQESSTTNHNIERISYIAWQPSNNEVDGILYSVGTTQVDVSSSFTTFDYNSEGQKYFDKAPVIVLDMQTAYGEDTATLRCKSNQSTGIDMKIEEEISYDAEVEHTFEQAGYIAILKSLRSSE